MTHKARGVCKSETETKTETPFKTEADKLLSSQCENVGVAVIRMGKAQVETRIQMEVVRRCWRPLEGR